jgi:hypothetical protein
MIENIEESYNYSNRLIHCLDNKDAYYIELNRKLSFIEKDKDGGVALLKGISDRKCYSFFTVALTFYLYNYEDVASTYIDKAKEIDYCDQSLFSEVIGYQIECIKEEYNKQNKYNPHIHKLDKFMEIIKNRDICKPEVVLLQKNHNIEVKI